MLHQLVSRLHHSISRPAAYWTLGLVFAQSVGAQSIDSVDELKKLSIEDLMEITVTSVLRSPIALHEAPSALQVVTGSEIRRSGALTLPEALRLASNLNVAQKDSRNWGISARGFNTELSNKLLVLLDGRTLYTPLFSGVRWNVQDYLLEDIDRIEVISGPGGTLWGANAVNGVINITSKSAKETQGFYANAAAGDPLEGQLAFRYGGKISPSTFYRAYIKHARFGDERLASGLDAGDLSTFTQAGFRADSETNAGLFTLQGDYYLSYEGFPSAGGDRGKNAGGNILTRWSRTLNNGSEVALQFYYDRTFFRQPMPAGFGPAGNFADALDTYDLDFTQRIPLGRRHDVVWGAGYRFTRDDTTPSPSLSFTPDDLDQDLFSAFIQDQVSLSTSDVVTVGAKLEYNDYTGSEISPNVRYQHRFSNHRMAWAAISRAVRMPSRIDRDLREPTAGKAIFIGGSDFSSERVLAYEVGYRAQLTRTMIGSVSAFYNNYQQIRSLNLTPVTFLPVYFANDLTANTYGIELSANWDVAPWWHLQGAYSLLKSDIDVRSGGFDLNNTLNETADPDNQVAITSSMDLRGGFEVDAQLRWVDSLTINNTGAPATVPAYAELNARVAYRINDNLEVSVVGKNLLDASHPEFWVPSPTRVEIRRSVFASLTWRY